MADHTLLDFLKAWLHWAENGAPADKPFSRDYGLCTNLGRFCRIYDLGGASQRKFLRQLEHLFSREGLSTNMPFGEDQYDERSDRSTQHEDPNRLAWVRKTIKELEG